MSLNSFTLSTLAELLQKPNRMCTQLGSDKSDVEDKPHFRGPCTAVSPPNEDLSLFEQICGLQPGNWVWNWILASMHFIDTHTKTEKPTKSKSITTCWTITRLKVTVSKGFTLVT